MNSIRLRRRIKTKKVLRLSMKPRETTLRIDLQMLTIIMAYRMCLNGSVSLRRTSKWPASPESARTRLGEAQTHFLTRPRPSGQAHPEVRSSLHQASRSRLSNMCSRNRSHMLTKLLNNNMTTTIAFQLIAISHLSSACAVTLLRSKT